MVSYPGTITGDLSVSGNATISGTEHVAGAVTLDSTLNAGASNLTSLTVPGLTTLGKVIQSGDYFQLSSNPTFTAAAQTASPMTLALVANATYLIDVAAIIDNATGISTLSWTGPAGATLQWNDTTTSTDYAATIGATNAYAASGSTRMALLRGLLIVSSTAGSLTMTVGVSAGTTTLHAGSWLSLERKA